MKSSLWNAKINARQKNANLWDYRHLNHIIAKVSARKTVVLGKNVSKILIFRISLRKTLKSTNSDMFCSSIYWASMRRHFDSKHSELKLKLPKEADRHACSCGRTFLEPNRLQEHMEVKCPFYHTQT